MLFAGVHFVCPPESFSEGFAELLPIFKWLALRQGAQLSNSFVIATVL